MSKRQENIATLEQRKYQISEAIDFFQSSPKVKFNEAIDTAINLGIDPSKSDQNMRGATLLPAGSGKPCKVAVFVEGDMAAAAKEAGADAVRHGRFSRGHERRRRRLRRGDSNSRYNEDCKPTWKGFRTKRYHAEP